MSNLPRTAKEYRRWWIEQRPDIPYGFCWCGCAQPTNISKFTARTGGRRQFKGEPVRYRTAHQHFKPVQYLVEDRGYDTECWIWQSSKTGSGYGRLGVNRTMKLAHRVYYERRFGKIPNEHQLDHLCKIRECVNPMHLEPVTPKENVHRSKATKLTKEEVLVIRALAKEGIYQRDIGKLFGVSRSHIEGIVNGRRWRD